MSLELAGTAESVHTSDMRVATTGFRVERGLPFSSERLRDAAAAHRDRGLVFPAFTARGAETGVPDEERSLVAQTTYKGEVMNDRVLACSIICALGTTLLVLLVLMITLWNRVDSLIAQTSGMVAPYIHEMVNNVRRAINSTAASAAHIEHTTAAVNDMTARLLPNLESLWNTTANAIESLDAMATSPTISLSAGR